MADRIGPIAPHIDQFAEFLTAEGYASQTIQGKCALAGDLRIVPRGVVYES